MLLSFFCVFVISVRYSIGIFYVKIKQIVWGTDPLSEISQMENHIQLHLAWLYIFNKHTKKNPIGDLQCSKIDIAKLLLPRFLLQLLHRTGRVYSGSSWYGWIVITIASAGHDAKLVVFNKIAELRPATMLRHYLREPCTPMKMEDAGSWNPLFYRPLLNGKKKINQRKRIFFYAFQTKMYFTKLQNSIKNAPFHVAKNAMSVRNLNSVVQV